MAKVKQMYVDYSPIWRDYSYWKQDIDEARANEAGVVASDVAKFSSQAKALGYNESSDYYKRGVEGINKDASKRVAQTDADWNELQSSVTTQFLMGQGDIGIGVQAIGPQGYRRNKYGDYLAQYNGQYNPEANFGTGDLLLDMGTEPSERSVTKYKEKVAAARSETFVYDTAGRHTPAGLTVTSNYQDGPLSMEQYYTAIFGETPVNQFKQAADEKFAGSLNARKQAGQSARGGGEAFTNVVPIEQDVETDEEDAGWWS